MKVKHEPKICLNPNCKKSYIPGHYGRRQKVGSGADHIHKVSCTSCKGAGKKKGEKCWKCNGTGRMKQSCSEWYRIFWSQMKKPPRSIPDVVFSKIASEAKKDDKLKYACLMTARYSGMRKGELLGITWSDIMDHSGEIKESFDLRGQWDDVEGFKPTKTGAGRTAYFLPEALKVLNSLDRGAPEERVFPFWESQIYSWFIGLQERLKVKDPETGEEYVWHGLRHSLGTELVHGHGEKGLTTAKEILGHRNVNTTLGYARQSAKDVLKDVNTLRGRA